MDAKNSLEPLGSRRNVGRIKESFSTRFFNLEPSLGSSRVFLFEEQDNAKSEDSPDSFPSKYEKLDLLGEGTVGSVWRCRLRATGEMFAVKVFRTRDNEILGNIKREFKHLKKLKHKNVVYMREIYMNMREGEVHLVMEFFDGKEMFAVLTESGRYSEDVARFLFRQLMEGIHYLHKNGVVHRDLKPNNILVSADFQLKITDFNVAKFFDQYGDYDDFKKGNYEMNTYTGTIAFRAPEMFEKIGYKFVHKRVDRYLGRRLRALHDALRQPTFLLEIVSLAACRT